MDRQLLRAFQSQVEHQCHTVLVNARILQSALNERPVNQEVFWAAAQGVLTAVANISKAMWGQGGRFANERQVLRDSIDVGDSSPLKPTSMRNNFDHFDERLDVWWTTSPSRNFFDHLISPANMIIGAAVGDIFRHYDPVTAEIIFWGDRYSLIEIVREIERILPLVTAEARKPHGDSTSTEGGGQ